MDLKMNRQTQRFVNRHKEGQILNKASLIDKKRMIDGLNDGQINKQK